MKNLTEQTAEQLFGAELRSEADDFIRLNTNTTGEIHENSMDKKCFFIRNATTYSNPRK